MAIVHETPDIALTGDIYAALNEHGAAPALMPRVAHILAQPHTGTYRTCITLGSILIGMALASAGFLADNAVALICAALCFLMTAVAVALWGKE